MLQLLSESSLRNFYRFPCRFLFAKLLDDLLGDLCYQIGRCRACLVLATVSAAVMAAGLAFLQVRAEVSRMTSLHAELSSDLIELLHLLRGEFLGTAQKSIFRYALSRESE